MALICDLFGELNDSGYLPIKQLEYILGLQPRSGYAYTSGTIMDSQKLRHVFVHCGRREVQEKILGYFINATGWIAEYVESDLDVNGDGAVNTDDVLDSTVAALKEISAALETERQLSRAFRGRQPEAPPLTSTINRGIQHLLAARQIVELLTRPQSNRRPA